jgi:hypothetical protein
VLSIRGTSVSTPTNVGNVTSTTITGLLNGSTYTFLVTATSAAGTSALSSASNEVTPAAVPFVPGAPLDVTAVSGDSSATISWSPPATDGNSPITNYVVTPRVDGAAQQTIAVGGGLLSTVVGGLTNGRQYTFTVAAKNAIGIGPESIASNAVTPRAPASAPAPKCRVPNVVGNRLSTAKTKIKKAHCRVGSVSYRRSTTKKKGHVLTQTPRPGRQLKAGTKVGLTVGRGKRR